MKENVEKVVIDVTTKKKYVKPDFEVIELNMEAPLLSASGPAGFDASRNGYGTAQDLNF